MKISYSWLKEYINIDLQAEVVAKYLTDSGLEVEGIETIESVKGGLKGVVIGEVMSKDKHPNADKLNITSVNVGQENNLQIICGAPNVSVGQKVAVATVGSVIYTTNDSFKIKKSKIRGEVSEGMICSESELGLGNDHDGIMVLENTAMAGTLASEFFKVESDVVFEIGLTPNRSDAMSHYGVARDLVAALKQTNIHCNLSLPEINEFEAPKSSPITVEVKDLEACPRYAAICIDNVQVNESPSWLKKKLNNVGLTPINNVVDITNFVLHEMGQPLHAFDASKIKDKKVIVSKLDDKTEFTTLDEEKRKLSCDDLMICNGHLEPMCIAGVFGGMESGVNSTTTNIFLESAYFDPISIRRSAKRHALSTDASFRFERGVDPNTVIYALKRAANLIEEICQGTISSDIIDIYPKPIEPQKVLVYFKTVDQLIGEKIPHETIKSILDTLEIDVLRSDENMMELAVPTYRKDVTREVDIVEEILRIYGFNNISIPKRISSSISYSQKPNPTHLKNVVSNFLSNNGFNECMNNSLTKLDYCRLIDEIKEEECIKIINPLSQDLNVLRQSLLFSGLENISHNINRKASDLSFYEFGKSYRLVNGKRLEKNKLILIACGNEMEENWQDIKKAKDFYWLKKYVVLVLNRLGIPALKEKNTSLSYLDDSYSIVSKKNTLCEFGYVSDHLLESFNIKTEVLYAEFDWDTILCCYLAKDITYSEYSKYPSVKRDLSLLLDTNIEFSALKKLAFQTETKLLRSVNLFDVYEGKNLPHGKKSYALSFVLENKEKTMTDSEIDDTMNRLLQAFEHKIKAEVRK